MRQSPRKGLIALSQTVPARVATQRNPETHQTNNPAINSIMHLQRTIGNRAVTGLLKSGSLQEKLSIGTAGDRYEREADSIAHRVVSMPEPAVQRLSDEKEKKIQPSPLAAGITPFAQTAVDEEKKLQKAIATDEKKEQPLQKTGDSGGAPTHVESAITAGNGGGRPLSGGDLNYFEPRFGASFGDVRVHTDVQAAQLSSDLNAQAFTVGKDVYFGAGKFETGSSAGKRLLAHELTHVVQQAPGTKQIQRQPFTSSISFNKRLFSRQFTLPAAQLLKATIDTKRVPAGCAMAGTFTVYLYNVLTKQYETTVSYEVDKRQEYRWKGLASGTYQFIFLTTGTIADGCNIEGTIEVTHEPAIDNIAPVAKGYVGNGAWAYNADKSPYGTNTNKCNLFVYDALNQAGATVPMMTRDRGFLKGLISDRYVSHPPLAGQWANPGVSISGWKVVSTPQPGDVAAEAIQYSDATGHVAIVSEVSDGGKSGKTISATNTTVVENDWGFRGGQSVVFRRYTGR